jgi:DNA-binding MarR family transcriptional regulator
MTRAASTPARPEPPAPASQDSDAITALGRSFKALMASMRRLRGRETHHPDELSYAQYSLLFGLAEGGECSARELALRADLSPATVTQMLDHLAAAGLVERTRCEQDKRIVLTRLTEQGQARVAARHARIEPLWRAALAEFSERDLRTTARVLDRLRAMFEDFEEPRG